MWKRGISEEGLKRIAQVSSGNGLFDKYIERLEQGEDVVISSKTYDSFIDYLDSIDHPRFGDLKSISNPNQVGTKDDLLMSFVDREEISKDLAEFEPRTDPGRERFTSD